MKKQVWFSNSEISKYIVEKGKCRIYVTCGGMDSSKRWNYFNFYFVNEENKMQSIASNVYANDVGSNRVISACLKVLAHYGVSSASFNQDRLQII